MRIPFHAAALILATLPVLTRAQAAPRHTITAGSLTLNPYHVVAVYRPVENQAVGVLLARPGGALQSIVITDTRDATAVFDTLWKSERVTKDPGDSDARPLTRMTAKDSEPAAPALIVNIDRVLAIRWDPNRRTANVYLDMPSPPAPIYDPNTNQESDSLVILNNRRQAEGVLEAYKAAVLPTPAAKENK
jgi:hypothetical protein